MDVGLCGSALLLVAQQAALEAAPPPAAVEDQQEATIQAEGQWHAGLEFGYALGSFVAGSVSGFAAGLHLAYGVSDAFNLRLHVDLSAFDLPPPATSVLAYHAAFGAEYLVDVLDWVPYVGLMSGPVFVTLQDGDDAIDVAIEPLAGLGYRLSPNLAVLAEGRFRQLLLQRTEAVPSSEILALGRFEYTFVP